MAYDYQMIDVAIDRGVAVATLSNPPINLITLPLYGELARLSVEIEADDAVRVLVMRSADPDFFLAHFDVEAILQFPTDAEPERSTHNPYHQMCEHYRTMEKITIAQIEGRVGGGGSEISQGFDMRFGVRGRTIINQMEVPIGILPGGTATQRLPRIVGRARALEIILAGDDLDAETAEHWGLLNRIFEPDEIGPFVDRLARRIASFPFEAVKLAKRSVGNAELPLADGLVEEAFLFQTLLQTDEAKKAMRRFLELGGQTREGELRVGELSGEVAGLPAESKG
jgi:enoyl-CoA hydratase/carnithine racemase